jgi:hypothetical protein
LIEGKHIEHWLYVLRIAEHQLDEATRRSDVDYAASRLMDAKLKLTQLGVALWLAAYIVALVAH